MRELSLHILDLAQNSVEAGAKNIRLAVDEDENGYFVFRIEDDGRGMSAELLQKVRDPFTTTRLSRNVGMGIPFIDMVTEQCGGHLDIVSAKGSGTKIAAYFARDNIDRPPLGNMAETVKVLLAGAPWIDLVFNYRKGERSMCFATQELRTILGETADFANPEVCAWIEGYLQQEIKRVQGVEVEQ